MASLSIPKCSHISFTLLALKGDKMELINGVMANNILNGAITKIAHSIIYNNMFIYLGHEH